MGKCVVTIEDVIENGKPKTNVKVEFEPALDNPLHGHKPTPAQAMGWEIIKALKGI